MIEESSISLTGPQLWIPVIAQEKSKSAEASSTDISGNLWKNTRRSDSHGPVGITTRIQEKAQATERERDVTSVVVMNQQKTEPVMSKRGGGKQGKQARAKHEKIERVVDVLFCCALTGRL